MLLTSRAPVVLSSLLTLSACEARPEARVAPPIRVAAASDLARAFAELGRDFEREQGEHVEFTFGSTGLLARQLRERAPFDMFAAASASFVQDVVRAGVCDGKTSAPYGRGRLALWSKDAPLRSLEALRDPAIKRIALANPEHAPYGRAAREALSSGGLWAELEPRVVYAENVREALQFASSGNAEAALVALSLVIDRADGHLLQLDQALHQPIEQVLVACSAGANEGGGKRFAAYVNTPHGRAVMRRYGFLLPGETLVSAQ